MKIRIIYIIVFLVCSVVSAQENQVKKAINKGKFFVYWGWNWANYSNSDIRFKGTNYDFTLSNVKALARIIHRIYI